MKKTDSSKGLTPDKQKRRPNGGQPSPIKPFKLSSSSNSMPKKSMYRKQGR